MPADSLQTERGEAIPRAGLCRDRGRARARRDQRRELPFAAVVSVRPDGSPLKVTRRDRPPALPSEPREEQADHEDAEMVDDDLRRALHTLVELREDVERRARDTVGRWRPWITREEFLPSARNLAAYLALRRRDLRPLQAALMPWGLSSLGRLESRVEPTLDAVLATLVLLEGNGAAARRPSAESFFEGEHRLRRN